MPDRPELLLTQTAVTGIDFVFVHADQVRLDVHFRRPPATLATSLVNDLDSEQVLIESLAGEERPRAVPVTGLAWVVVDGDDVLRVTTGRPGDFSLHRLTIDDLRIDPYYNGVRFSFKANCESGLDCRPRPHECPPEEDVDFPVDYRARDFWSFRRALLDMAAQRYPDWEDGGRVADVGTMLVEAMSALGDELAYFQDRVGREAYLETATQRRSLRRHARLVDHTVHDGLGAWTWLDVTATAAGTLVPGPTAPDVRARSESDVAVSYEIGRGLRDATPGYAVSPGRNGLRPHVWDEDDTCLFVGTTELHLEGHRQAALPLDDLPPDRPPGRWVLLRTQPDDPSVPARAHPVRLVEVADTTDPVLNQPITRLVWEREQALPFELELASLELRGNLLPASAGRTAAGGFAIGDVPGVPQRAVERVGPDGSVAFLFTLPDPGREGLVWAGSADPRSALPEVRLFRVELVGGAWVRREEWEWRRTLLGSQAGDRHFTLDDGTWERVVGFRRGGTERVHVDYARGEGSTVRFGDGEFGLAPPRGTVFEVEYRLGNGRRGNVAAGSLVELDPQPGFVESVTNPLAARGGVDPETPDEARRDAPEEFRAIAFRAVRPEDYAEAAERLPWVQRAGAAFRWTGSWLSAFVTPDPRGAVALSDAERAELLEQLDRFRQAGREAHALDPVFADIDLEITICVEPSAYPGDVEERVLEALLGRRGPTPRTGFFSPDNFTFGTPLERAALEARIQAVPGVRAVEGMRVRRRGRFPLRPFDELSLRVAPNEVVRLENDQLQPERGSLAILTEGGA